MITIYSDPHLGTERAAHTTPASSAALNRRIFEQAMRCAQMPESICLGDLFDKTNNTEKTILQGAEVALHTKVVLAGNHDVANREGVVSSLHALAEIMRDTQPPEFILPPESVGGTTHCVKELDGAIHVFVPHHASQKAFMRQLVELTDFGSGDTALPPDAKAYLHLHCNVNFDLAADNDAVLNLPDEMTEELLSRFNRIFVGHEHNSYTRFDDRLVVVGNTHPTSFSDLSDKYVWELDSATDELRKVKIWSKDDRYLELVYGADLSEIEEPERYQFITVVGRESVATGVEVSKYIAEIRKLCPNLLMCRQEVELVDVLERVNVEDSSPKLFNLSDRISDDLKDSDLQGVWDELRREADL